MNVNSDLLLVGSLKIGHFFLGVVIDHNFLDVAKLAEKVLLLEKWQARKRFGHSDHIQKVVLDNTEVEHPFYALFLGGLQGAWLRLTFGDAAATRVRRALLALEFGGLKVVQALAPSHVVLGWKLKVAAVANNSGLQFGSTAFLLGASHQNLI